MSMMFGARNTQSCEINVTPLIDVLLVLLIIFMVILPDHKWGEKTLVPQPSTETWRIESSDADCHPIKRRGGKQTALAENQSGRSSLGRSGIAPRGGIQAPG